MSKIWDIPFLWKSMHKSHPLSVFSTTLQLNNEYLLNETRKRQSLGKDIGNYKGSPIMSQASTIMSQNFMNFGVHQSFYPPLNILFRPQSITHARSNITWHPTANLNEKPSGFFAAQAESPWKRFQLHNGMLSDSFKWHCTVNYHLFWFHFELHY